MALEVAVYRRAHQPTLDHAGQARRFLDLSACREVPLSGAREPFKLRPADADDRVPRPRGSDALDDPSI
jgi:hypothetical protein